MSALPPVAESPPFRPYVGLEETWNLSPLGPSLGELEGHVVDLVISAHESSSEEVPDLLPVGGWFDAQALFASRQCQAISRDTFICDATSPSVRAPCK